MLDLFLDIEDCLRSKYQDISAYKDSDEQVNVVFTVPDVSILYQDKKYDFGNITTRFWFSYGCDAYCESEAIHPHIADSVCLGEARRNIYQYFLNRVLMPIMMETEAVLSTYNTSSKYRDINCCQKKICSVCSKFTMPVSTADSSFYLCQDCSDISYAERPESVELCQHCRRLFFLDSLSLNQKKEVVCVGCASNSDVPF